MSEPRRKRRYTLLSAAGILICVAGPTYPQGGRNLASVLTPAGEDSPEHKLEFYAAVCTEDERYECVVASLVCGEYNGLSFDMVGFSDHDLGRWFSLNGATAILKSDQNVLPMHPTKIEMEDLDGTWFITFLPSGDDLLWLRSLDPSPSITVTTIQDDMLLPQGAKDKENMNGFISGCLAKRN